MDGDYDYFCAAGGFRRYSCYLLVYVKPSLQQPEPSLQHLLVLVRCCFYTRTKHCSYNLSIA
jgi:hypothetical protein